MSPYIGREALSFPDSITRAGTRLGHWNWYLGYWLCRVSGSLDCYNWKNNASNKPRTREHPSAEVLGIDLSPIQPQWYDEAKTLPHEALRCWPALHRTPPNCTFEVDDFESEWLYTRPFDFIHARELEGCIANEDRLFRCVLDHLAPGGYFELQGIYTRFISDDGTAETAVNCQLWINTLCDGMAKFGKPLDHAPLWKDKLKETGFVDVREEIFKVSSQGRILVAK